MPTGKIKFFNRRKGFGFVVDDENQIEIFIHVTGLINKNLILKPNDSVSFEIMDDAEGKKKAINVEKL
jgi:cold shock protein